MDGTNNIDNLFKSKLTGRETAYSPSAWAGAEKLLARHYKLLFVKKLLAVLVTVVSTVALVYIFSDEPRPAMVETEDTAVNNAAPNSASMEENPNHEIKDSKSESPSPSEETRSEPQSLQVHSSATSSNERSSLSNPKSEIANSKSENRAQSSPSSALAQTKVANSKSKINSVQIPPDLGSLLDGMELSFDENPASTNTSENTVGIEVAKLRLANRLALMRRLEISLSRTRNTALQNPARFGEPTMRHLRKVQVFGGFGALVATGFHDLNGKRMSPALGLHAEVLAMYHLSASLHMDLGVGAFNRGSLTKNLPFMGSTANSQVDITPVSANYGSVFVGFGHRIGARHSIGCGMQINPLIAVIAKEERSKAGGTTTSKYINDKNGFLGFDAAAVVNYRLSIAERWDATTAIHIGFLDNTDNAVFRSGDVNDYNTLAKVGLSYRFTAR